MVRMPGRPLLFVDIDGVLNPYGGESCPVGFSEYDLFRGEEPVRLSASHAQWLRELSQAFDLMWASSWSQHDRALLGATLRLPPFEGEIALPTGRFDPREKVPAVDLVAGVRPLAWVDDLLTVEAWQWAAKRTSPTLLVPIDPTIGLTRAQVDELFAWLGTIR